MPNLVLCKGYFFLQTKTCCVTTMYDNMQLWVFSHTMVSKGKVRLTKQSTCNLFVFYKIGLACTYEYNNTWASQTTPVQNCSNNTCTKLLRAINGLNKNISQYSGFFIKIVWILRFRGPWIQEIGGLWEKIELTVGQFFHILTKIRFLGNQIFGPETPSEVFEIWNLDQRKASYLFSKYTRTSRNLAQKFHRCPTYSIYLSKH